MQTSRWRRLRREFIDSSPRPWLCGVCGLTIDDESQIEVDHIRELGASGDPWDRRTGS
jgi:hypothetical protein